jgi:PD-(D/E)XK nuclease superfamily
VPKAKSKAEERVDWRHLPPVPKKKRPKLSKDWKPSQTFLGLHDNCDRAAMLYLIHGGGAGGHELNRGAVFHDVVVPLTRRAIAENEPRIPPEWAKDELRLYYEQNPDLQVSAKERDALRYMIYNWCVGEYFDPTKVLLVESTFRLEIGGFVIVGRIDRADSNGYGRLDVIDYKTSLYMPDREEFIPQAYAPDGRPYFAGNFQTMLYATALAFGEIDDGMALSGFEEYGLELVYPRHLQGGALARRGVTVTAQQLLDFKLDVEDQLTRLRETNLGEGRWQPTPGSHCGICPAEYECPLPRVLRPDSQLASASIEKLEEMAARWNFETGRNSDLKKRIKDRAAVLGEEDPDLLDLGNGDRGIRIGEDLALVFIPYSRESVKSAPRLAEAAEEVANYGGKLDLDKHFRRSSGTEFEKRKVVRRPPDKREE